MRPYRVTPARAGVEVLTQARNPLTRLAPAEENAGGGSRRDLNELAARNSAEMAHNLLFGTTQRSSADPGF